MLTLCKRFQTLLFIGLLEWVMGVGIVSPASANTDPETLAKAVNEIEYLDAMRSGLAATLEDRTEPPTLQTMKQVCMPVGMRAQELGVENGWQVRQVASKYRNPAHAPQTPEETEALGRFEADPNLQGFWQREIKQDQAGTAYYRRIDVEAGCLACHGGMDDRPQFVKDKYPGDRAYDFNIGDLRGMYAVFIPDLQAQLEEALSSPTPVSEVQ